MKCIHLILGPNYLHMQYDVIPSAFQNPYTLFPSEQNQSRRVANTPHKMNVSVSKHLLYFHQPFNHIDHASQARYWLILREIPTVWGKIALGFQVNGKIIQV